MINSCHIRISIPESCLYEDGAYGPSRSLQFSIFFGNSYALVGGIEQSKVRKRYSRCLPLGTGISSFYFPRLEEGSA